MAADEKTFKPGDTDNTLLRKILMELNDGLDISGGTINIPGNINATVVGGNLTSAGAVTIADGADVAQGATTDTKVTDGNTPASVIALLKGIINGDLLSYAKLLSIETNTSATSVSTGATGDAAVTNPASSASVIAALKGILTADNTTNTNVGAVADAAVTNPASSASVIAALKGILTGVNKIPTSPATDRTTAAAPFSVELSDGAAFYTGTKTGQLPTALVGGRLDVNIGADSVGIGQQRGSLTNRSGSMTTGGASQQVAAALATRKYFFFQNISTETMWINFGTAAVQDQPSLEVLPHASFVMENFFVSTEAINVISATTGSKFVAKEA